MTERVMGRSHFFLTCFAWVLLFCNFFRRLGNLVAGFLTIRLSFLAITCSPLMVRLACQWLSAAVNVGR